MKTKYTPGTPEGLVGKTHSIEVVGIEMAKIKFNELPLIKRVRIKYKDGKTEWISGMKFYDNTSRTKDIIHITY